MRQRPFGRRRVRHRVGIRGITVEHGDRRVQLRMVAEPIGRSRRHPVGTCCERTSGRDDDSFVCRIDASARRGDTVQLRIERDALDIGRWCTTRCIASRPKPQRQVRHPVARGAAGRWSNHFHGGNDGKRCCSDDSGGIETPVVDAAIATDSQRSSRCPDDDAFVRIVVVEPDRTGAHVMWHLDRQSSCAVVVDDDHLVRRQDPQVTRSLIERDRPRFVDDDGAVIGARRGTRRDARYSPRGGEPKLVAQRIDGQSRHRIIFLRERRIRFEHRGGRRKMNHRPLAE